MDLNNPTKSGTIGLIALLSQVFVRSSNKHTLYRKTSCEGDILLVCIYVDDMIYFGSSQLLINTFRTNMKEAFEMSDLCSLHYFFGLELFQGSDGIFISQMKYTTYLLKQLNMQNRKTLSTPVNANGKFLMHYCFDILSWKHFNDTHSSFAPER